MYLYAVSQSKKLNIFYDNDFRIITNFVFFLFLLGDSCPQGCMGIGQSLASMARETDSRQIFLTFWRPL